MDVGEAMTTVSGFQINADEMKNLAAELKRRCGTGGSVKDGEILIQGDHRDKIIELLNKEDYKTKRVGG